MGILNAIFAPFIVIYILMYSFFRYFEVSPRCLLWSILVADLARLIGISQEPLINRVQTVHLVRQVALPRIQRAASPIRAASRRELFGGDKVHQPVSKGDQRDRHEVSRHLSLVVLSLTSARTDSLRSSPALSLPSCFFSRSSIPSSCASKSHRTVPYSFISVSSPRYLPSLEA